MSAPPYMKLFVADYLADTTHLSRGEHGAYLLLLMAMWRAGGRLPAKDDKLAKIAKCSPKEWASIRETILAMFQRRGGLLMHKRLSAELAKAETVSTVRTEASIKGVAEKRRKNSKKAQPKGSPNADQLGTYSDTELDKNPPNPPEGDRACFEQAFAAYPLDGRTSVGPDQVFVEWRDASERAGGDERLLAAVKAHAERHAGKPDSRVKRMDRWLRDGGFVAYLPAQVEAPAAWTGPPEVFDIVEACMGPAHANGYLRHCRWEEAPVRAVIAPFRFAAEQIRNQAGAELSRRLGASVLFVEGRAA